MESLFEQRRRFHRNRLLGGTQATGSISEQRSRVIAERKAVYEEWVKVIGLPESAIAFSEIRDGEALRFQVCVNECLNVHFRTRSVLLAFGMEYGFSDGAPSQCYAVHLVSPLDGVAKSRFSGIHGFFDLDSVEQFADALALVAVQVERLLEEPLSVVSPEGDRRLYFLAGERLLAAQLLLDSEIRAARTGVAESSFTSFCWSEAISRGEAIATAASLSVEWDEGNIEHVVASIDRILRGTEDSESHQD